MRNTSRSTKHLPKKLLIPIITILVIFSVVSCQKQEHPLENVLVTTGGAITSTGDHGNIGILDEERGIQYDLPITVDLATQQGWAKASTCMAGEGVYYTKPEEKTIILIFDADDDLIGIYQHSTIVMSEPWVKTQGPSKADGSAIVNYEHYGIYLFLLDPSNACDSGTGYESLLASHSTLPSYSIPASAESAIYQGWPDPFFCSQGRGEYFTHPEFNHVLMYSSTGEPIGIYQHTEHEMPKPWLKTKEIIGGGGVKVLDKEHYGMFIYFRDNIRACKTTEAAAGSGSPYGGPLSSARSTPTAYVEPTATPEASTMIAIIVDKLSGITTVELTASSDPEGLSVVTEIAAVKFSATLTQVINSLETISYASNTWINNVSYKGISGTTKSENLKDLVPDTVNGRSVKVTVWVTEDRIIKRLRVDGASTDSDTD